MPWVDLTQEEVEKLRNKKHELTEYDKQRLREMMTHEEMLEEAERREKEVEENIQRAIEIDKEIEEAAERERPFYRFFAIEYFATGEGRSFWLKVCRNYDLPMNGKDYAMERFVKFIGEGAKYYLHGLETPTQEEFMEKYARLIPPYIVKMIERRDQPEFDWETHLYFNYS